MPWNGWFLFWLLLVLAGFSISAQVGILCLAVSMILAIAIAKGDVDDLRSADKDKETDNEISV